jgi:hypothetical protein
LHFLSTPVTAASVGRQYVYNTDAGLAAGKQVTFALPTHPAGMTIDSAGHIRWTPQASQWPRQSVTVKVTDLTGHSAVQSFTINVADSTQNFVTNPVIDLPADTAGSQVTLRKNGTKIELLNNRTGLALFSQALDRTQSMLVNGGSQSDQLLVDFAAGGSFKFQDGLVFQGGGGTDTLVVRGGSGSSTIQVSRDMVVADGLLIAPVVEQLRLESGPGNTAFRLWSSTLPVTVVDTSGASTLDFSGASGGGQNWYLPGRNDTWHS